MQYTVRAFVDGRDGRLDVICRTFCSMERTAYNLLREGMKAGGVKGALRERYGVENARWCQSVMNQARAAMVSQEEGIRFRIEQCREKAKNIGEKMGRLSNPLKIGGCAQKLEKCRSKAEELRVQLQEKSYPRATFGSAKLMHQLSIAGGERRKELRKMWREKRSDHFFSVGQANQRGNGNARLSYAESNGSFLLEIRNWPGGDFSLTLHVPDYWSGLLRGATKRAEGVKLGRGKLLEGGIPYSVRVIRASKGYQVLVSFEFDEQATAWTGRLAGIDINPEGIACTVVSKDGNLVATRFFRDTRLVTASKNKRKWILEDLVNKMLSWCKDTHGCNAVAIENLKFKGAYDYSKRTNFRLSNFMKRKIIDRTRLSVLKMSMLSVEVDPAYTSMAALAKHGKRFGGFNRHQLAAFVVGRRALGYGEAPVLDCLPKTRRELIMWNHCIRYYGYQPQIQTLPHHEPMEWKSDEDVNGGEVITELFRTPPAVTSARGSSHAQMIMTESGGRAGWARLNPHTREGDGARGRRANPPDVARRQSAVIFDDKEDNAIC